jgi:hypothetical protein
MDEESPFKESTWKLSFSEFKKKILKPIYLNPKISSNLIGEVNIIQTLLEFSYYDSNLIDEAYTKAIFTLEKVLRVRKKELGLEKKNEPLFNLFNWFYENNYFESANFKEIDQLRLIRNDKVHSTEIKKGSLVYLINIYSILDLMNDVYEDISLRKDRQKNKKLFCTQLNNVCKDGFIITLQGQPYFGHFASILFFNNKSCPHELNIRIGRCIVSKIAEVDADRDNFDLIEWTFTETELIGKQKNGDEISIKAITDPMHIGQIKKWKEENPLWSLDLFNSLEKLNYQQKLREFYKQK